MSLQIKDIFLLICNETNKNLVKLNLISKFHTDIIKTNHFNNTIINIKNVGMLEYVLTNYKFGNLNFESSKIDINPYIDRIKYCHTLNLSKTNVSNNSVIKLRGLHTLLLSKTSVTDSIVSKLKWCHTLDVSKTNITDSVLPKLKNCYNLNLCKTQVCEVYPLHKCHTLDLSYTDIIYSDVHHLKCHTLNISNTDITDLSIKYVKNCHTLNVSNTTITDINIKYLNCVILDVTNTKVPKDCVHELTLTKNLKKYVIKHNGVIFVHVNYK